MRNGERLIGVLGGTGSASAAQLVRRVLERTDGAAQTNLLVLKRGTPPDAADYLLGCSTANPLPALREDAVLLARAGCDALVLPCNTAHVFYDELQAAVPVPLVHLPRLVARAAAARGLRRLCVLGTDGVRAVNLYGAACRGFGVRCAYPEPAVQALITEQVYDRLRAGRPLCEQVLRSVIELELDAGFDGVALGCAELSEPFQALGLAARYGAVLDSLELLAEEAARRTGKVPRPAPEAVRRCG